MDIPSEVVGLGSLESEEDMSPDHDVAVASFPETPTVDLADTPGITFADPGEPSLADDFSGG
jgi:hypothetical protein